MYNLVPRTAKCKLRGIGFLRRREAHSSCRTDSGHPWGSRLEAEKYELIGLFAALDEVSAAHGFGGSCFEARVPVGNADKRAQSGIPDLLERFRKNSVLIKDERRHG
jgi:hypothetical protein